VGVPDQSAVLLGLLMLRGPQTAGELRINTERWHRFADISSVEAFLDELRERSEEKGGPLVVLLPRAPRRAQARWAHLLCGPVDSAPCRRNPQHQRARSALQERVQALEAEVAALKATVARLCAAQNLPTWSLRQDVSIGQFKNERPCYKCDFSGDNPWIWHSPRRTGVPRRDPRLGRSNLPRRFRTRCTTPCA
jgi:hypothetical protein